MNILDYGRINIMNILDYGRVNIMNMIKTLRLQALAGRLLDLESQMLSLWEKSSFYFSILNNVNPASTWNFISKIKSMQIKEWGCQSWPQMGARRTAESDVDNHGYFRKVKTFDR